ncbi:hypothetical protein ABKV19_026350 [Rosa sericea]
MASLQNSSHSSDSNSSQSFDSNSNSKAIALPTPTVASRVQTIPKTFKSSKRKAGVKRKHGEAAAAGPSNVGDDENEEAKEEKPAGRSWVWLHFKKIEKPQFEIKDGKKVKTCVKQRAKCNYCETDLACDSYGNGTSSLRRHIQEVCKKYPGRVDLESGQHVLSTGGTKELVMVKWSQEACREAACKMIVMDELPFSFIERPGFRYFCSVAVPRWDVPSRRVIVKLFLSMYKAARLELKKELRNHCLCLTTDTWTSVQNINYMVVTAHFIDAGWTLHKRILNFRVIPDHQGNSIGKLLEACLLDWEVERVLTISVDNASANKVAIEYVRKKMLGWEKQLVLGGKYLHVRCLAHILNLIVRSGLKMMEKSIASIRNAIRYVRSSGQRLDVFKQCAENEKVESKKVCILDVPTRWNSTFLMLDTALQLRKAFDRMVDEEDSKYTRYFDEEEDIDDEVDELQVGRSDSRKKQKIKRVGPPVKEDWEKAAVFVRFLKVFYDVTMRISASNHPTSWKAFHDIVAIKSEIDELFNKPYDFTGSETEMILFDMTVKMRGKFDKYFGSLEDCNKLLFIALVLNPRFKIRNFESICNKWLKMKSDDIKKKSAEVKELLVALCDLYSSSMMSSKAGNGKARSGESSISQGSKSSSKRTVEPTGKIADMEQDWEKELEDSDEAVVAHEVDRYLLDPIEKPAIPHKWDILEWWKLNGVKYPNLAALAKDVLAIQVSTVASESCFSTGRRVIDPFRSSLTPKTVEALICYQNWIRSESINNIQYVPSIEDIEFYESVEDEHAREERGSTIDQPEKPSTSKSSKASKNSRVGNAGKSKAAK